MAIESVNPATGELIQRHEAMSAAAIRNALRISVRAQYEWRRRDFAERAARMRDVAALLRRREPEYSVLMAREMGKPLAQGRAEIEKCATTAEYYAEHAGSFLAAEPAPTDARRSLVVFRPLGLVLAIMPWNFPFWQVIRFAAPALMAGNGGVLKHASNVPGCALALEQLFRDAGLPEGIFRTLLIESGQVGDVIAAPEIAAVTLTGSSHAGRDVAARAGAALKKTVLELGGSDPCIVLEDADIGLAAETCAKSRLINSGQSCIAAKRFIVVEGVRREFTEGLVRAMEAFVVGNPLDQRTEVGPLAREDLREGLHRQVTGSLSRGARRLTGGEIPDGPGWYYPPTVLADVRKGMPAFDEELFGPVAAIIPARDEAEAVGLANESSYGLGAAVFTRDLARGERIAADELEAGSCFVNALVRSDPRLPFGGIKDSGYGRELSAFGIREFVNIKAVYVK